MTQTVRVGDLLRLERHALNIDPANQYRRIGIYSWGKGIIHHPPSPGTDLESMRYYTFPPGALVLSNIQAWEAAVAVSTDHDARHFVCSNRFLPYVPIQESTVDVHYLKHYFLSEHGLAALQRASPGTQVRNRTLGKYLFEDILVPLPDLGTQQRVAGLLSKIEDVSDLEARLQMLRSALGPATRNKIFNAMR